MSGFQRKETWNVVPISDDDDSSNKLVIDEVDSSPERAETPLDMSVRKRLTGFNEDDSECSKSEVEVVRQSPEMPECDQQKDIPKDLSGRKRPIGVDEDQHSDSTKTGNENPEMPKKRDFPPGRDGRMPREIRNPSGHVHSAERPRMEGNGVGITRPSTSNTFSTNYDLPGTSFGSNGPTFQDLKPLYENILQTQSILDQILPRLLQQGFSNPQAKGRKGTIGVVEDHSNLPKTGNENPEIPEQRGIPPELSGQDRRMPREFWNPSGHEHASKIPRMEDHRVGIAQPSTSGNSTAYDPPGALFGSNGPTNQDLIPLYKKILQGQLMLEQILPRLQFWQITSNPQAKGRKGTIGVDEDHSDSTKTGDEIPELRDIPPELSGRDGRMNPAVQVHSPKRSRMEGRGVGIAQPSTSGGSIDLNLPGTLFGSNRPTIQDLIPLFLNLFRKQRILQQFRMQQLLQHGHSYPQAQAAYDLPGTSFGSKRPSFQDLIPVYENILKSQRILVKILPQLQLQQGISNPQAREVVPAAPEHPSGSRSQGYEQLNREDRECPREDHMNKAEHENRYHCPVCGKSYRNKGEARVHEIGHKNRKTD